MIDASKLADENFDGIKRYTQELLRALIPIARTHQDQWELYVCLKDLRVCRLLDFAEVFDQDVNSQRAARRNGSPKDDSAQIRPTTGLQRSHGKDTLISLCEHVFGTSLTAKTYGLFNWLRTSSSRRWPRFDLVHLTLPNTWSVYRKIHAPLLTTVHDLSHIHCPHYQTRANIRTLHRGLRFALERDSTFIAISDFTKQEMLRHYPITAEAIHVTYEACDEHRFQCVTDNDQLAKVRDRYGIPDTPYLLSVGTLEPRKNLINTIRAFRRLVKEFPSLDANLVITGPSGWENLHELKREIGECRRIRFIGYADDADLPAIYSGATALSYVSRYEGFGLPPLEAMSCGVPVIYGNVSAMPEVVGDAGLPADPSNVAEIKERFLRILIDRHLRQELAAKAIRRAREFRWREVAKRTMSIYQHCTRENVRNE